MVARQRDRHWLPLMNDDMLLYELITQSLIRILQRDRQHRCCSQIYPLPVAGQYVRLLCSLSLFILSLCAMLFRRVSERTLNLGIQDGMGMSLAALSGPERVRSLRIFRSSDNRTSNKVTKGFRFRCGKRSGVSFILAESQRPVCPLLFI